MRFLLTVLLLAVALYLAIRLAQTRGRIAAPRRQRPPQPPPRPVAPDDDPEFLRELDRKRRQQGPTDQPGETDAT